MEITANESTCIIYLFGAWRKSTIYEILNRVEREYVDGGNERIKEHKVCC